MQSCVGKPGRRPLFKTAPAVPFVSHLCFCLLLLGVNACISLYLPQSLKTGCRPKTENEDAGANVVERV